MCPNFLGEGFKKSEVDQTTSGNFISPDGDAGTLVSLSRMTFDGAGYETKWESADGLETLLFSITSGFLWASNRGVLSFPA